MYVMQLLEISSNKMKEHGKCNTSKHCQHTLALSNASKHCQHTLALSNALSCASKGLPPKSHAPAKWSFTLQKIKGNRIEFI